MSGTPTPASNLPYLQRWLSVLSESDWMHQIGLAVGRVDDYSAGPVVTWTESLPWGWVTWALDTTFGYVVPRPGQDEVGQLTVREIVVRDPAGGAITQRQTTSHKQQTYMRRSDGSPYGVVGVAVPVGFAAGGAGGFIGGGVITRAVGAATVIPSVWGGIAGGMLGIAGWLGWRERGRRHTRTWHQEQDPDVPVDVAMIGEAQHQVESSRMLDPVFLRELSRNLDQYRWNLADPDQVTTTRTNLDRTVEEIRAVSATAEQIAGNEANERAEILDNLAQDYPADTSPDDGVAESIRLRLDAVRQLHGLADEHGNSDRPPHRPAGGDQQ